MEAYSPPPFALCLAVCAAIHAACWRARCEAAKCPLNLCLPLMAICKIGRLPEHRFHSCYELFGERVVSIFHSISHYVFAQPPIGQSDHAVPEGDDGHIPHFLGDEQAGGTEHGLAFGSAVDANQGRYVPLWCVPSRFWPRLWH